MVRLSLTATPPAQPDGARLSCALRDFRNRNADRRPVRRRLQSDETPNGRRTWVPEYGGGSVGDRRFESISLQGRVQCEPEFPCSVQAPSGSALCARGKRSNSRCRLCCDYRESLDSCVSAPLGGYFPICTLRDCLITPPVCPSGPQRKGYDDAHGEG